MKKSVKNKVHEAICAEGMSKIMKVALIAIILAFGSTTIYAFSPRTFFSPQRREQQRRDDIVRIFDEYLPFGLVYNRERDRLYFEGELVRYFEDIISEWRFRKWPSEDGVVDVFAVRDEYGLLIGVQAFTQEDFDGRNLSGSTFAFQYTISNNPADTWRTNTRREDNPALDSSIRNSIARTYAVYEPFGLIYNRESDWFYFNGESIDYFEDYALGRWSGTYREGGLNIHAVRDTDGNLIGIDYLVR